MVLRKYTQSGNGAVNADQMYDCTQIEKNSDGEEEDDYYSEIDEIPVNAAYGHFDLDQARTNGGDDRKDFMSGKDTSNILYWWHVLDELQLLTLTCVAMRKELGVSTMTRPIPIYVWVL